jgi:hypothetical protein
MDCFGIMQPLNQGIPISSYRPFDDYSQNQFSRLAG